MTDEGGGVRKWGERVSLNEKGRNGGSEVQIIP